MMGNLRRIIPALLCLTILNHSVVQAFPGSKDKELAKKVHELCKKILHEIYVGRHSEYEHDQSIPQNVRTKIQEGESAQTVAMGVDKKNKRIIVAGNVFTNEYKKGGSYMVTQPGFLVKEMKQIYSTIRNVPEFKDFSITVVKPDGNEMKIYQNFASSQAARQLQQVKSKWWDAQKRKMENAVKELEANKQIPPDAKREKIQTARENFSNLKPPQSLLDDWKEYEQTAGTGEAARAVHAQVQIEKYLEKNLGLSRTERKNFVIQASKPYTKPALLAYLQKAKSNQGPKNWGHTAKIVTAGYSSADAAWR